MTTTHVSWVESGVGFEGGWQDRTWRQQAWATLPGEFAVTGIREGGGRCAGMQGGRDGDAGSGGVLYAWESSLERKAAPGRGEWRRGGTTGNQGWEDAGLGAQ